MMTTPRMRALVVLLVLAFSVRAASATMPADGSATNARPNFLVILCDDLGYGDLSCYGHPAIQTPRLNQLAASGIRFTDFYACAPVCSPSRVGLLTGRSPNRAGVYDWIPACAPNSDRPMVQMRPEEITVAELLRTSGYATCMAGKWHCNALFNAPEQAQPGDQGFEHWLATQNNAAPSHENPVNFVRNGQPVGPLQGFSCQLVADEVITWLRQHQAAHAEQPFFVYCAFHEPHEPVASPADLVAKYTPLARNVDEAQYFANVENVDRAVGRLLETLADLQLRENTLVVFSADNGPETLHRYRGAERSYGRPGPLRGMKLHTYDGGLRVAGIVTWPARIRPGQVSHQVVSALDLLPTFCRLANTPLPAARIFDGTDLSPAFDGQTIQRDRPLVWAYYNALNEACVALRDGPWKVLGVLEGGRLPKSTNLTAVNAAPYLEARITDVEVYDVSCDAGETVDLAAHDATLRQQWLARINAAYRELAEGSHVWRP
jgi:arylsulfatase A